MRTGDVTLRQLEVFVAVAQELHFGRAAARLHVSQPVISQEVHRLERSLGGKLFDRTTRTVTLTEMGRGLLPHANAVQDAVAALAEQARGYGTTNRRAVTLACTPSIVDRLLPRLLRAAEAVEDPLNLREIPVETGSLEEALLNGRADVGLGRFLHTSPGLVVEDITREPVHVAISSDNPLAGRDSIDLIELAHLPLLIWPREQAPDYYDALLTICHDRRLDPLILTGPSRIVGVRSYLIAEQRAFALIPESTASTLGEDITTIALSREAYLPTQVIYRRGTRSGDVLDLLALIRATVS